MTAIRIFALLTVVAILISCSRKPSIDGRYIKTTPATEFSGWKTLDFKPNGTFVINDDMTSTYRIEKGVILMKAGILEFVGELSGEDLVIDKELYKKQAGEHQRMQALPEAERATTGEKSDLHGLYTELFDRPKAKRAATVEREEQIPQGTERAAKEPAATAVEPLAQIPQPKPVTPVPASQIPSQPASEPAPPRPAIISMPDGNAPTAGEIPRARPISPVAKIAAADSDVLADLSPPKPRVISRGAVAAPAKEENSALAADSNTTVLEAKRKSWVTVRTGPGGQTLFEDYLYPTTKPLRLPKGRYFIELRDADAVAITRNGQRIRYSQPGVAVE